jgi:endonuclease/exonuclease/phosphatase family metal-dependent hydrolase
MSRLVCTIALAATLVTTGNAQDAKPFRVATFNCSLNRQAAGELVRDLATPNDVQAKNVAEVIQRVRPDVILLNEFDHDEGLMALDNFMTNYLATGQNGAEPIVYPYRYAPTVNTGVASGLDLDNDGVVTNEVGSRGYGNDAFGFGQFPGQYGMVLLSQFPINQSEINSFQSFLWHKMPNAQLPVAADGTPWFDKSELPFIRLSSKNHCDVPIRVGDRTLHVLISHPTPPAFDGPEKRNVKRNHDEIRLWVDYINGGDEAAYLFDGRPSVPPEDFVILGDMNADPDDGSGDKQSIRRLLSHPRVNTTAPTSKGAAEAVSQGGANAQQIGAADRDTADFDDRSVGNLRVDYVLPSTGWKIVDWGVFWPASDDPLARLVAMKPKVATSDHRLVWVDLSEVED